MSSSFHNWLEPKILSSIIAASLALWIFVEIAENVVDGDVRHFDTALLMALHGSDSSNLDWFSEFVRDISGLGGLGVLALLVSASVIFLVISNNRRTAIFVALATISGAVLSSLLKLGFDRPRPDLIPHLTHVYSTSFPSGHAMVSAVVYLTLGALLTRVVSRLWSKFFVMAVAVLLTGLIGLSRLYLGVHWPSDVLAGWAAGATWALVWWTVANIINLENGEKL
ncbi:MAG TPA: phosphatase PAP2 family protein [Methylophilaceae bacterium]|nr:phosphatase PAP2 family protein [Methylophilaceae bacterium]HQC28723.1 phosphatase PAP2 family protein [Methylotenera sp.]